MYVKPGYTSKKTNIFLKIAYVLATIAIIITIVLAASYYYAYKELNELTAVTENIKAQNIEIREKAIELEEKIQSNKSEKEKLEKDMIRIKPIEIPEGFFD